MAAKSTSSPPSRATYRHGDLRRALLEAGVELARAEGPAAVVLREATRRVGVVPNAAYRHFESRQALLEAVRSEALLAAGAAMKQELDAIGPKGSALKLARAGVRAVGTGYLRFAQNEPGLFRTAFGAPAEAAKGSMRSLDSLGPLHPFRLLGSTLDRLVVAGALPASRRPDAEYLAWSAVHGLALLLIDGPLLGASALQVDALSHRILDMVERGL